MSFGLTVPRYAVDPDGVEHVAQSLRLSAEFGPAGPLAPGSACGSAAVEAALDEAGDDFVRAWDDAYAGIDSRAAGAIEAALGYRESENRVCQGAKRRRR